MKENEKSKFRQKKVWKAFRRKLQKERKFDPITGSKLTRRFNLHHCDFDPEHYTNLDPNNFECLNSMSHDVVHFFFGSPGQQKDWRVLILRTIKILKKMEQLNKEAYQMAKKEQKHTKTDKKEPKMTLKEKRAAKRAKKEGK